MPDDNGIESVTKPANKPRQVRRAAGGQPAATVAIWPNAADHRPSGYRLRGQKGCLIETRRKIGTQVRAKELWNSFHADLAFHMAVFAASKNQLLYRFAYIIANLLQISFRIQQQTLNEVDNRIEDDHEIHVDIFQAINLGDPGRAEAAMLRAVMNGKTSLLRARAGETLRPGDDTETRRR